MLTEQKYLQIKWIWVPLIFLYLIMITITAWLSDDAYITFRTIDNLINGNGLIWNIGERVQAFTHPFWMFTLVAFQFITREVYFTSVFLSIIISFLAFYILIRKLSASTENAILVGLILIFSKAFVDYSTSGLESLIILLPALVFIYFKEKKRLKGLLIILASFLPLFAWEIFSLFYYGFFFPNTAYAKLNTGINQSDLIKQGLYYLLDSLYLDPLTFFALLAGILAALLKRKSELIPLAVGAGLHIIYIVNIGGDFMSGRFLSAPLLCAVIILARTEIKSIKTAIVSAIVIIGLGFFSPRPNF